MDNHEKLELYKRAKEAYYNGQEIMTDYEFDALEHELGLENRSYVGTKHNKSYTVKHPFVMGSISKVQIHKDKNGNIDWNTYFDEAKHFFKDKKTIITPKFDGCSFEVLINDNGIQSISSRGDGNYGKDLIRHLMKLIPREYLSLGNQYTLRGEVLVDKQVFETKYAEKFTNPRSFVSGVLNREYNEMDNEFMTMLDDLSIVIYDYRVYKNGEWHDHEWTELKKTNVLPDFFEMLNSAMTVNKFKEIYEDFSNYRKTCRYALDGIVIKPQVDERINNTSERRPKDCIAIKFIPMLEQTSVINITWNLGKTNEYTPIIWVNPIEMDGRIVQKCSGHNLGYLRENGITIGSKIIMSLAGDIIPFMYKVTEKNQDGDIPMPTDHEYYEDDIHLMAILSQQDHARLKFVNSAQVLNIPGIGCEMAKSIFDYLVKDDDNTKDFFGIEEQPLYYNILQCKPEDIYYGCGGGKNAEKAKREFTKTIKDISLVDIIKSCNFKLCGPRVAEQCASYLINGNADFEHLAREGYSWVLKESSTEKNDIYDIIAGLGKTIDDFRVVQQKAKEVASNQIPIIMTGEPNDYQSKGEFLKLHPEYRNTGSWREVKIVFTNSMDSNTGKMKRARELGIEIRLY